MFKTKLKDCFLDLIEKKNINTFNFGFYGQFNDLCYEVLLGLKQIYPQIQLILYSLNNEVAYTFEEAEQHQSQYKRKNKSFPYKCFDEIVYLKNIDESHFKFACVLRNKNLIDESEYCVIYFRKDYSLPHNRNSGTKIAYEYAKEQKKKIIIA